MKRSVVIGIIIGILLLGFLFYFILLNNDGVIKKSEIEKKDFIASKMSVQGMLDAVYLFEDRKFLIIHQLDFKEPQCYESKISSEEYNSFIRFIESKDFFDTKITQLNDWNLLCEGTNSLNVNLGGKSNSLMLPCVENYKKSTKEVELIMSEISKELNKITNISKQVCKKGGFIITYEMGSCLFNPEKIEYETYAFSDLNHILKESLSYEGAYVYAGQVNETIESYHRKYYRLGDSCYFVRLSVFDGKSFSNMP